MCCFKCSSSRPSVEPTPPPADMYGPYANMFGPPPTNVFGPTATTSSGMDPNVRAYNLHQFNQLKNDAQSSVGLMVEDVRKVLYNIGTQRASWGFLNMYPGQSIGQAPMNNMFPGGMQNLVQFIPKEVAEGLVKLHSDLERFPQCTTIDELGRATFSGQDGAGRFSVNVMEGLIACQQLYGILQGKPMPPDVPNLSTNLQLAIDAMNKFTTHHPLLKMTSAEIVVATGTNYFTAV